MQTGERVKLFRNLKGWTQTELAEILDTSQRAVASIEKMDSPHKPKLKAIAELFGCSTRWFLFGRPPAFDDFWGYAELPPANVDPDLLTKDARKVNQLSGLLQKYFPLFLKENKVSELYIATEKEESARLFVFPLRQPITLMLKVTIMFWKTMDSIIEESGLKIAREITVDAKLINRINAVGDKNTDLKAVQKLFSLLGIEFPEKWFSETDQVRTNQLEMQNILRSRKINQVSRTIQEHRISPVEVLAGLREQCTRSEDFDFLRIWEKGLLND